MELKNKEVKHSLHYHKVKLLEHYNATSSSLIDMGSNTVISSALGLWWTCLWRYSYWYTKNMSRRRK